MKYKSPITYHSKYMANFKVFEKWVKLQGQGHKFWYYQKGLFISPITCHSKDMANAKVFEKWVNLQGQRHKVKNFGTN
jgi:hypothetical protein